MGTYPALSDTEHHPRDFTHDRGRALDALRLNWGDVYVIGIDATGLWWALRRDGMPAPSGADPDSLHAAIAADCAARPPSCG